MKKRVTFATACYEKDWRRILWTPHYLEKLQIAHHKYPFFEKLLVINNVSDPKLVRKEAEKKIKEKILTRVVLARDIFSHFQLKAADFNAWQYYNALGPLTAVLEAEGEYLLYVTGDVYLQRQVSWIAKAIRFMEKNPKCKVANLTWNQNFSEAKRESYRKTWNFFVSKEGFSDQMFLVKCSDFKAPIYGEIREDASHFPRGDVWEKRVFSYMKNHGWERIIYRRGSYIHESV